jgi:prepilin-type N-terminal cleavage/methylation domain-containing protein
MSHTCDALARSERGFTIIEFMVAIALLSVLMLGVTSSFTTQQHTYVVIDQVVEAKQNVRVVADLVERELRNAGYMVPHTAAVCGVDDDAGPDKLYISDYGAIVDLNALDVDLLNRPLGAVVSGVPPAGLTAGSEAFSIESLDLDGGGVSDFAVGSGIMVVDRNQAVVTVACGTITNIGMVAPGAVPIQADMENATGATKAGTEWVAVPAIVYEVVNNQLLRNGVPIVDQVDDFQIAWFFDLDDDQLVDPGEYLADGVGVADDYDPENLDASLLREVRINLVIRTRDEDPNETWQQGIGQVTENRDPNTVAPADGARRRLHNATVRIRNNVS